MDRKTWEKDFTETQTSVQAWDPSAVKDLEALESVRLRYLGRKGELTNQLKSLKDLSLEDKRDLGPRAQKLKEELESRLSARLRELESAADESAASGEALDVTLPGFRPARGRLHPVTQIMTEMANILALMGFSWAEGPLAESDHYNFGALNMPADHPARDMQDTFYLQDVPLLMRTHTSPVQIRAMESQRPPLKIVCPGRVFRHEAVDASHSAVFHQVEGLAVDKGITFADLKGTLQAFMQKLLGPSTRLRFRPSFFPFTEPSAEVAVQCWVCAGAGCGLCKKTGWIEMLGAGLVHPKVLAGAGYDPEAWSGFAFGIGVERIAMLRLGITDIRAFYENDVRFLRQFDENLV